MSSCRQIMRFLRSLQQSSVELVFNLSYRTVGHGGISCVSAIDARPACPPLSSRAFRIASSECCGKRALRLLTLSDNNAGGTAGTALAPGLQQTIQGYITTWYNNVNHTAGVIRTKIVKKPPKAQSPSRHCATVRHSSQLGGKPIVFSKM